jgi:phosphoribosylanthranilate isomerase
MPKVKFCGLVHDGDVNSINALLPEFVGFVFWDKSKRNVSADEAARLRELLDSQITTVGVFVNTDPGFIVDLYNRGIIQVAQLHGNEDAAYIEQLRALAKDSSAVIDVAPSVECSLSSSPSQNLEIWRAFKVVSAADVEAANLCTADLVLMDAGKGCGQTFDWSLLANIERPFALAGGLSAENVHIALAKCSAAGVCPAIVDVSSGIEADTLCECGRTRKDFARMQDFLRLAKS